MKFNYSFLRVVPLLTCDFSLLFHHSFNNVGEYHRQSYGMEEVDHFYYSAAGLGRRILFPVICCHSLRKHYSWVRSMVSVSVNSLFITHGSQLTLYYHQTFTGSTIEPLPTWSSMGFINSSTGSTNVHGILWEGLSVALCTQV